MVAPIRAPSGILRQGLLLALVCMAGFLGNWINLKELAQAGELQDTDVARANPDGNRLVTKMSSTISDFRNFFRKHKEKEVFTLGGQVRETASLVGAIFKSDAIAIAVIGEGAILVQGMPNEYSQVLLNLLANARDAIQARGLPGRVEIRLGCLDRIFEPYFSTKPKGTGVGLYMSRMIAERSLDGRLEVRNGEAGAEFTLWAPLAGVELD